MASHSPRHVAVLAPMPLEFDAIAVAFGLRPVGGAVAAPWTGEVGDAAVTLVHNGMGPAMTRAATSRLFDVTAPGYVPVDHVMIAGICGGLDPHLEVGTVINPAIVVDYGTGAEYRHTPPGDAPLAGKLVMTESVSFDRDLSVRLYDQGCIAVDMESAAVAEVCSVNYCPWSVYRCISDRHFDGLLDERIVALSNPDGSANIEQIQRLMTAEPDLAATLERLGRDASLAAQLAAEAAFRGFLELCG